MTSFWSDLMTLLRCLSAYLVSACEEAGSPHKVTILVEGLDVCMASDVTLKD